MNTKIDFNKIINIKEMKGETKEETTELMIMWREARNFIESFNWCKQIKEEYFGLGYPGIVAVFLFKILPSEKEVDEWLWIIVGDLPSAYIITDNTPNPATALDAYIGEMDLWVNAIKQNKSIEGLISVNVSPTLKNADALEKRLNFIDKKILSLYKDDLKK